MNESGIRKTYWTYTLGGKIKSKQKPNETIIEYEYDNQGNLIKEESRKFQYDSLGRLISGSGFKRTLDPFGNILKEELENGLTLENTYDIYDRPIERILPNQSKILYKYEGPFLKQIIRIGKNGKPILYHDYKKFDSKGLLLEEKGLFTTLYTYDKAGRRTSQKSPCFAENITYDLAGNIIQKGNKHYAYDDASQLTSEENSFNAEYDLHRNCIKRNEEHFDINELNQRTDLTYDLNGNLLKPGFVYDEFDQLIHTGNETYSYDALGRRIQAGNTSYFYIDDEEIGNFENGKIKELKVLGNYFTIAIEIDEKPYSIVTDVQNNIKKLIDNKTGKSIFENNCNSFGYGITKDIPYAYVGKRYDASTGLIYFGKRFYDPNLRIWITKDPLRNIDHSNLYQYVFNNPYLFQDPNGESVLGFLCGIGEMILGGGIMASGAVLEVATFGGYSFALGFHESVGLTLLAHGCSYAIDQSKDITFKKDIRKNDPPDISIKNDDEPEIKPPPNNQNDLSHLYLYLF